MTAAKNMIREISTSEGTSSLALAGAAAGYRSFADAYAGDAPSLLLRIYEPGGAWEVGVYNYVHASRQITRPAASFIASSTGAAIDFEEGSRVVEPLVPPHAGEHDGEYLRIDAANDPVTGDLRLSQGLHVDGDVGIGTASPQEKLHVSGGDVLVENTRRYKAENSSGQNVSVLFINAINRVIFGDASANTGAAEFYANGVRHVTLDGAGNVGVGDPSPSYDLDVNADINAQGELTEAGFRAICVETDGRFKVALYSSSTPRGFTRIAAGVEGAAIRLVHTGGGSADITAARKDVGSDFTDEGHALAITELAAHQHTIPAHRHDIPVYDGGAIVGIDRVQEAQPNTANTGTAQTSDSAAGLTGTTGDGDPHAHTIKLKYADFGLHTFVGA